MSIRESGKRPYLLHIAVIRQSSKEITHPSARGQLHVRCHFGQRYEREPTLVQRRMGDREVWGVYLEHVVQQYVDIYDTWPPAQRCGAPQAPLCSLGHTQQR